ncbi:MAG: zinc-ribbon domain-containing protein [Ruminococcaceae bacterium]|nr:zinc-ribbon domain-containing protein [Oscillospiraceae bacterium]
MKFCFNCGTPLEAGVKFCPECGQKIPQPAAPAAQPAPPAKEPVYVVEEPAPVVEKPAPVVEEPAPVVEKPAPVVEEPAPVVEEPAPVVEEPAPAVGAGIHVYGEPVVHSFSAPAFSESAQSVVYTYGEPVVHSFTPAVQAEAAVSGTYEIPVSAVPAAPAPAAKEKAVKAPKEKIAKEPKEKPVKAPKEKTPKAPKEPKPPKEKGAKGAGLFANKKLLIIIAAAIIVILAIILICCTGGGSAPELGLYKGVSFTYAGSEFDSEDEWIELKSGGKGTLNLMGDEYSFKWELDGEEFTITQNGDEYTGTLKNGIIVLDFEGVVYTYEQEEKPDDADKKNSEIGYWTLKYSEGDPATAMDEESVEMLKYMGIEVYVELYEGGTGVFCFEEAYDVTWRKGKIVADGEAMNYSLENNELILIIDESIFHFVRAEGENGGGEDAIYLDISSPEYYKAVYGVLQGNEFDEEKLAQLGDFSLTFYGDGTGEMNMFGTASPMVYDNSTITSGGVAMSYDYDYDSIYLYISDEVEFSLEYMGVPESLPSKMLSPNDLQYYAGDYYGWWCIDNVIYGDDSMVGDWWDCCASFDISADGSGHLTIWDENSSKKSPLVSTDISVSVYDGVARVVSEDGQFLDDTIEHADWLFYSDAADYDNAFIIDVSYEDSETEMDCYFFIRPWGTVWDDVEEDSPEDLPYYYYDWYLPLLDDEVESAPNKIS